MTKEAETKKEAPTLQIKFLYDHNFFPDWFCEGEIVDQISPEEILKIAANISELWQNQFGLKISKAVQEILQLPNYFFEKPHTCWLVDARVQVGPYRFIDGDSHPLSIYAGHPDQKWGFLPFWGRLTHELVHNFVPLNNVLQERFEDQVFEENREWEDFWQNQKLREELVVRKITYEILANCFGKEFADWFNSNESRQIIIDSQL